MEPRGWWVVVLTAVAGPVGGFAGALAFARIGDAVLGGMGGTAAAVSGLILGGPLVAIIVFSVCLFTLLRDWDLRTRIALALMVGAALLDAIVIVLGLRAIGGTSFAEAGLIGLGMMSMAVLGAGAHLAISNADR